MTVDLILNGGTKPLKMALGEYQAAWKAFIVINHLEPLDHSIRPAGISWKVESKVALFANLRLLGDKALQIHIGTINDRFIAMALLKEPYEEFRVIKFLERQPRSHDPLGLDSIDYYVSNVDNIYDTLKKVGAKVVKESNEVHEWLSLRFGKNQEFEAKFMDHSLLDIGIRQLEAAKQDLDTADL